MTSENSLTQDFGFEPPVCQKQIGTCNLFENILWTASRTNTLCHCLLLSFLVPDTLCPIPDHVTNGTTNICLVKAEVQLTKLRLIIASVLSFSLPVRDIISWAVMKEAPLNEKYHFTQYPLHEQGFIIFLLSRRQKHFRSDTPSSTSCVTSTLTVRWNLYGSVGYYSFNAGCVDSRITLNC